MDFNTGCSPGYQSQPVYDLSQKAERIENVNTYMKELFVMF